MTQLNHSQLNLSLQQAAKQVLLGSIYKHYKYPERDYQVKALAIQEATEKVCVIYHDIARTDAPPFVRNLDSWLETVEWEGQVVPRFTHIDES